MPSPQELIEAFERAVEEHAAFAEAQSEDAFHHRPAPGEWSAAEIAGHVSEYPIWLSEQARRLSQQPGLLVARPPDDAARMAGVNGLAAASPAEAAAAIRAAVPRAVATLRGIPADRWQVAGKHPALGDCTVADIVEKLLGSHTRAHLKQAKAAVGAAGSEPKTGA